jgi:hypothetical protein
MRSFGLWLMDIRTFFFQESRINKIMKLSSRKLEEQEDTTLLFRCFRVLLELFWKTIIRLLKTLSIIRECHILIEK